MSLSTYRSLDAPAVELLPQLPGDGLQVHEVAESGPAAHELIIHHPSTPQSAPSPLVHVLKPAGFQPGFFFKYLPGALSGLVLPAAGLPEVGDRRQLSIDRPTTEPEYTKHT